MSSDKLPSAKTQEKVYLAAKHFIECFDRSNECVIMDPASNKLFIEEDEAFIELGRLLGGKSEFFK